MGTKLATEDIGKVGHSREGQTDVVAYRQVAHS
jgi:hypothetical protein